MTLDRYMTTVTVLGRLHTNILGLYAEVLAGLRAAGRAHDLASIGIDSWGVDFGLLDSGGELLGNPVHYRDRRTEGALERVLATVPADELYAITGTQLLPFNTLCQLVAAGDSPQLACAARLLLLPDLLGFWLSGQTGAEVTNASTTQLLDARTAAGIAAYETDLAELIVQLGHDRPSHILVPAIHRNRAEIRDIFLREMPDVEPGLTDEPAALAEAARRHLRRKFLTATVGISGVNFAIAETGTLCVLESEGNGRMCLTLPQTLITVMGIEKVIPTWADLGVFLQLLPRSSTGERMNPYTSMWTGVTPGDGPQTFHLILVDNGRTAALADPAGRPALHCIRCSACLNVCPVYERTGGHAYGSVYPGPIGAVLSPQLTGIEENASLPYASSLCGACYDACPVKTNIPELLVHLRARHVEEARAAKRVPSAEAITMAAASWVMSSPGRFRAAQRAGRAGRLVSRAGRIGSLPPPMAAWTRTRDAPEPPRQTFRQWWRAERGDLR